MDAWHRLGCMAVVMGILGGRALAHDGEGPGCPRPSYSCCHYWLPSVYRFRAFHSPPHYGLEAIDPALATVRIERYPCRITTPDDQAEFYRVPSLTGPVVEQGR